MKRSGQAGKIYFLIINLVIFYLFSACQGRPERDLENIAIILKGDKHKDYQLTVAEVITSEVNKRTGFRWDVSQETSVENKIILSIDESLALKSESYHLKVDMVEGKYKIEISSADKRGLLYGAGKLLRMLEWQKGNARLPNNIDITSSPEYPLRGHQLGYRALANSYDAWTPEIYEQYIRELALFGTNSIEIVPFSGGGPLMKVDQLTMNVTISEICEKYDLDMWIMTGVGFDLSDTSRANQTVAKNKKLYDACPRLDGVFFAGGDPGISHPKYLMPMLEQLAGVLEGKHAKAKVWTSLQHFDEEETDYFFNYVNHEMPSWLGGVVHGPASPWMPDSRARLPQEYQLRHYPDLTHSCRGQYPVSWWDPAFGRTLGRECPNPQPEYYALIHDYFARYTDGFISYSDGMHDDLNKVIWSAKSWNTKVDIREVVKDYTRFFFRPDLADRAADGILALEKNWIGALANNGSVEATLSFWQELAKDAPELNQNWRWQLCQLRSKYDAYIRHRVIYERGLEKQVNEVLAKAATIGADEAISRSKAILNLAIKEPVSIELREDIEALGEDLFKNMGFQTSVEKYGAYSLDRGAIMDYLDTPMNNRLWLEDEFEKILAGTNEDDKLKSIEVIVNWENPGEGSYYDDIGTLDRSPHLVRGEDLNTDPLMKRNPNVGFWYWNEGFNRLRLSWLVSMDRPVAVVYDDIDPTAEYDVRVTGYRVASLQMNGDWVEPFVFSDEKGAIVEYHVPAKAVKSGKLTLNWGDPEITEVWLIKK